METRQSSVAQRAEIRTAPGPGLELPEDGERLVACGAATSSPRLPFCAEILSR